MPAIVEFPTVVSRALEEFGALFENEPSRRHFAEYLTGLLVAERKNVSGINAEFAVTTDQSCLNRWINEVSWDAKQLNEKRLEWLQSKSATGYSAKGVIPIDNVLIDHSGELIEDVGWFWDHAEARYKIAHNYVIVNYVCTSGKHYPLEFRRFRKEEQDPTSFKKQTELFRELVDFVVERNIPGTFAFDCFFTSCEDLNHINKLDRYYVADLKFNRKVWFKGRELKASELAAQIPVEIRKPVVANGKKQWYFTKTIHIPNVDHPVRIVILWKRKNGKEPIKMMIANRTHWEINRILGVYRRRWTGTETFHRDGKQHLGMGDCQLRNGEGQTRHMYLVMMAYSLLMVQMRHSCAREWTKTVLTTIGEACRAVCKETFARTIDWAIERATYHGWNQHQIYAHLAIT